MDSSLLVDENLDSSNVMDAPAPSPKSSSKPLKTPLRRSARGSVSVSKSSARASSSRTPASKLVPKHPSEVLSSLSKLASAACATGGDEVWRSQARFAETLEWLLCPEGPEEAVSEETLGALAYHCQSIVQALAAAVTSGRSGLQASGCQVLARLFEKAGSGSHATLLGRLDSKLPEVLTPLLSLVAHVSSKFLHKEARLALLSVMRHGNTGRVASMLAESINSRQHDKNRDKMKGLALLLADAADMLRTGRFQSNDYSCTERSPLPPLSQNYIKSLVRATERVHHHPTLSGEVGLSAALVRMLDERASTNSMLTAECRELAKTERELVAKFDAIYASVLGRPRPQATGEGAHLASPHSTRPLKRGPGAGMSSTLNSPLAGSSSPLPLRRSPNTPSYSATMPRHIGSPLPLRPAAAAASTPSKVELEEAPYEVEGDGLLEQHEISLVYSYEDDAPVAQRLDFGEGEQSSSVQLHAMGSTAAPQPLMDEAATMLELQSGLDMGAGAGMDDSVEEEVQFKSSAAVAPAPSAADNLATPVASARSSSSAASSGKQLVYNYTRGSMEGSSSTLPPPPQLNESLNSSVFSSPTAAAESRTPKIGASGVKRKAAPASSVASASESAELERILRGAECASPNSKLAALEECGRALKRSRPDAQVGVHLFQRVGLMVEEVRAANAAAQEQRIRKTREVAEYHRAKLEERRNKKRKREEELEEEASSTQQAQASTDADATVSE